jgi:hypothetical protein
MARRKNPDQMTAEDEVRSVLAWARRMGFSNITEALQRALDKWPAATAADRLPSPPASRSRNTGRVCGS